MKQGELTRSGKTCARTGRRSPGGKRIFAALLALVLVLALLPSTALAVTSYNVWVQGVQVTNGNEDDVLNDGGTVQYDPTTGTLTLNDATITAPGTGAAHDYAGIYAGRNITIALVGSNTITATSNSSGCGIYAHGGTIIPAYYDITVSGGGSLTVRATSDALNGKNVTFTADCGTCIAESAEARAIFCVESGNLTVAGGNVTATGSSDGMHAGGDITVSGGTVTATGNGCAIDATGTLGFSGSYAMVGDAAPGTKWAGTDADTDLNGTYKYVRITPVITTQPQDRTVTEGSVSGALTVAAASGYTCQWYMCTDTNKANPSDISDATSATYNLSATMTAGTYYYFCKVSLNDQSADSRVATVTVNPALSITITPNTAFLAGASGGNRRVVVGLGTGLAADDIGNLTVGSSTLTENTHYTKVTASSVNITLMESWLNSLSAGTHRLNVPVTSGIYDGETRSVNIVVTETGADVPETGDGSMPLLWTGLMLLAGTGLVVLRKRRRA